LQGDVDSIIKPILADLVKKRPQGATEIRKAIADRVAA
jgi:hypothetical protein